MPTDEASFRTGKVEMQDDDDDDMLPQRRGGRVGCCSSCSRCS